MKKILLIPIVFVIIFSQNSAIAQQQKDTIVFYKHEFCITLDNLFDKQMGFNYPYIEPYYLINSSLAILPVSTNIPKAGVAYKYHFNNSAIRSKLSFGSNSNTNDILTENRKTERKTSTVALSLGYQWEKTYDKFQVFYGIDITIKSLSNNYEYKYVSDGVEYMNTNESYYDFFGISPLFGMQYYFSPKFSVSTEIKYVLESFEGTEINKYSGNENETKSENSGTNSYIGPVGNISVNWHF